MSDLVGYEPSEQVAVGVPSGPAGGALTGTYPNPGLNAGAVAAAIGGTTIDIQTSAPLTGGGVSPLGGATPAPVTLQAGVVSRSALVWNGTDWIERRAGQRVQLATFSAPVYVLTQWFSGQYVGLDSTNKSYSAVLWEDAGAYSPEADSEIIYRWTVKFSQALAADTNINVWRRPYAGAEYDTGIVLAGLTGNKLVQNLTDDLVLYTGDELLFVTDTYISVQHIEIFAHRLDNS